MARDEFLASLRRAERLHAPTVEFDSPTANGHTAARKLARAALWLTPRAVEGYDPGDFGDWPANDQAALRQAVDTFCRVAAAVPAADPATDEQFREAATAFRQIVSLVRARVLPDWQAAADELVARAEEWARRRGWPTHRKTKDVSENLLHRYDLPKLHIDTGGLTFSLDPVARFVPSGEGLYDLSVSPSGERLAMLVRHPSGWEFVPDHPALADAGTRNWDEGVLLTVAERFRVGVGV